MLSLWLNFLNFMSNATNSIEEIRWLNAQHKRLQNITCWRSKIYMKLIYITKVTEHWYIQNKKFILLFTGYLYSYTLQAYSDPMSYSVCLWCHIRVVTVNWSKEPDCYLISNLACFNVKRKLTIMKLWAAIIIQV